MIFTSFAPAKVNLYLHVGAPRADSLHPLDSLVAFAADVGDVVAAAPGDALSLDIAGPFAPALTIEADNLVLRAARALADGAGIKPRAAVRLEKNLPVASGIGGGSSDAAAALRVLNRLWEIRASEDDLEKLAAPLGADVPACVRARSVRMRGVGADLTPVAMPSLAAVLVNPLVAAPTGQVYRAFDHDAGGADLADTGAPPGEASDALIWLGRLRNDLAAAAQRVAPVVGDVLATLSQAAPGALVRMSGSGATCFALIDNSAAAASLARTIAARRPDWWVRVARLGDVDVGVVEG